MAAESPSPEPSDKAQRIRPSTVHEFGKPSASSTLADRCPLAVLQDGALPEGLICRCCLINNVTVTVASFLSLSPSASCPNLSLNQEDPWNRWGMCSVRCQEPLQAVVHHLSTFILKPRRSGWAPRTPGPQHQRLRHDASHSPMPTRLPYAPTDSGANGGSV